MNKRRLDQDITKQEKVVYEAEEELKRRESAIKKADYVSQGGNLNWNQVRKHTLLIENYCKKFMNGRIPGKDAISDILKKANEEYEGNCGQAVRPAKKKGNPAKKTLQEHGVIFPSTSQRKSEFSESEGEELGESTESKVTKKSSKQSDLARAIPKNTDKENSQLELAIQASFQSKKGNNIDHADDTVEPAQMAMPMAMFPYNYFNPLLEHYRPPFVCPGPYTGINFAEQGLNNVHSFGQYAQPMTRTITNASAVDSTRDTERTVAVSTVPNYPSQCTGLEQSSYIAGPDDQSAAMALLTLKNL